MVDCTVVVQEVRDDFTAKIEETNAAFNIGELPKVEGYKTELKLLFQNLISNAIKFQKEDKAPKLKISAERKGYCLEFSAVDNGIGIREEYLEKVFVIFKRLHLSIAYEGTGIGLAHFQKIASLHEGEIWVKSKSKAGEGSTFYFTIPA